MVFFLTEWLLDMLVLNDGPQEDHSIRAFYKSYSPFL